MAGALIKLTFDAEEVIFEEGEVGREAYIIEKGAVAISKGKAGSSVLLGCLREGEMIGEMALIDNQPRMATARAMEESTLIVIPKIAFTKLKAETNPIIQVVLNTLLKRFRSESERTYIGNLG